MFYRQMSLVRDGSRSSIIGKSSGGRGRGFSRIPVLSNKTFDPSISPVSSCLIPFLRRAVDREVATIDHDDHLLKTSYFHLILCMLGLS